MAKTPKIVNNIYNCKCCCNCDDGESESPAAAQLISGSGQLMSGEVFACPGGSQSFQPNTPGAGLGETAAQVRFPAGTITGMRISAITNVPATGGNVEFVLRVNGTDTPLTCQLSGSGDCDTASASLTVSDDDRVCVKATNNLAGVGLSYFTFSFLFTPS